MFFSQVKAYKEVMKVCTASLIQVKEVEDAKIACDKNPAVAGRRVIVPTYTVSSLELHLQSVRMRASIAKEMAFDTAGTFEVATAYVSTVCAQYRLIAINAMSKHRAAAAAKAKAEVAAAALHHVKTTASAAAVADTVPVAFPTPIPMIFLTKAEPTEGPTSERSAKLVVCRRRMGDGLIPRAGRITPAATGEKTKKSRLTRRILSPSPSRLDAAAHRTRLLDELAADAVFQGGQVVRPPTSDVWWLGATGAATERWVKAATTPPTPAFFGEWIMDRERVQVGVMIPRSFADATKHVKDDRRPASSCLWKVGNTRRRTGTAR